MNRPRRNVGVTPGHVVDPLLAYLHRLELGRDYTPKEIRAHLRAYALQVDGETVAMPGIYRSLVAQLIDVYGKALESGDLIAKTRALGESVRTMRALHLIPREGKGATSVGRQGWRAAGGGRIPPPARVQRQMEDVPEAGEPAEDAAEGEAAGEGVEA